MEGFLVPLLLLTSFQLSSCIKCTTDVSNPCKCFLSEGAVGIVDISPLFKDGPLTAFGTLYETIERLIGRVFS